MQRTRGGSKQSNLVFIKLDEKDTISNQFKKNECHLMIMLLGKWITLIQEDIRD